LAVTGQASSVFTHQSKSALSVTKLQTVILMLQDCLQSKDTEAISRARSEQQERGKGGSVSGRYSEATISKDATSLLQTLLVPSVDAANLCMTQLMAKGLKPYALSRRVGLT
jgi:hypothetical protein